MSKRVNTKIAKFIILAVLAAILRLRLKTDWLNVIAMPFTFMILSYVALRAKLPAEYTAVTGLAATRSQTL